MSEHDKMVAAVEEWLAEHSIDWQARATAAEAENAKLREALEAEDAYWAASRALAAALPRLREGARLVFDAALARRDNARAALETDNG